MERRHEPTRLEGFSDAVFGFALTLLVVALEVPENFAQLENLLRGFLPFALMFAMICWIWYEHQIFFRRYGLQDAWTIAVNSFLLFVVLFYVYPLKYLTVGVIGTIRIGGHSLGIEHAPDMREHGDTVMMMYSAGVVMIFGAFIALYRHAWRRRDAIGLTEDEQITLRYGLRGHMISGGLGVVSILMVLVLRYLQKPEYSGFAGVLYMMMGPLHTMNGYQSGKAHAALRKKLAADAQR